MGGLWLRARTSELLVPRHKRSQLRVRRRSYCEPEAVEPRSWIKVLPAVAYIGDRCPVSVAHDDESYGGLVDHERFSPDALAVGGPGKGSFIMGVITESRA